MTNTTDSISFSKFFPRPIRKAKPRVTAPKPPKAKTAAMINRKTK